MKKAKRKTAIQIPESYWSTERGIKICNMMHDAGWGALDELGEIADVLSACAEDETDPTIKPELLKALKIANAAANQVRKLHRMSEGIF